MDAWRLRGSVVAVVVAVMLCLSAASWAQVEGVGDAPPSPLPPRTEPSGPSTGTSPTTTPAARPAGLKPTIVTPPGQSGRNIAEMARRSATGVVLPNAPIEADLDLKAGRTTAWKTDKGHMMLLEGDVRVAVGTYAFGADRAVVMISPFPSPGPTAHQLSIYLDKVTEVGGYGPIRQEAPRLLVTSVITGRVKLATNLMQRQSADANPLVVDAQQRFNRHFDAIAQNTVPLANAAPLFSDSTFAQREQQREQLAAVPTPVPKAVYQDLPPELATQPAPGPGPGTPGTPGGPTSTPGSDPALSAAMVDFHAGRVVFQKGEGEGYVLLTHKIQVMYVDPATDRRVSLTADRGVIFTAPDLAVEGVGGSTSAQSVRGIYLEDDVIITDGQYTLRGPRVFYDVQNEKAVVLDAVFYTWDVERQLPLYVRAQQLRQHSPSTWSATDARLTTSEFGEPHFAIGVKSLRVQQSVTADGQRTYTTQARDITLEAASLPVFYWPSVTGDGANVPLRSAKFGYGSRRGAVAETSWDLFALMNTAAPKGVNAQLLVDGYTDRGPGVGVESDYDVPSAFGEFNAYYLYDTGEDEPGGRLETDPDTEHRGRVLWRHRHELGDGWEATAELAWLSDPNFLEEFFREDAYDDKQYESLIYLKQQRDDWAFTFLTKYDLLDFIPQLDTLQTVGNILEPGDPAVGYTVDKLPELAYLRVGTSLWDDRLTWFSENRFSIMQANLPRDTPRDRGFTAAESVALFGIANGTGFNDALETAGIDDDTKYRFDTRQEIDAPLQLGRINVVPYAVGRFTGYDDGFEAWHGESENLRLWGAVGMRASTSFSRNFEGVEDRLLDLHRMRHIVEPYVDVLYAHTNVQQEDLPVYDYDVESLAEGAMFNIGVRNTFQTQRGGPGQWRNVDWIALDTRFVFDESDEIEESPIARFFPYRPELSLQGDHIEHTTAVQLTDTLAVVQDINYSFEHDELSYFNIGATIDHSPRFSTFVFYRDLNVLNSQIIDAGIEYLLTPKYHTAFSQSYDLGEGELRDTVVTVTRRLPRWLVIVSFAYDQIEDVTSVGVALAPEGFPGRGSLARNPFLFRP
jgi:hypothetical protein